jgi:DNA polymerase-3 subunit epsilon
MRIAVVDTETSGTGPEDRILEFAFVMMERRADQTRIVWGHSALHDEGPPSTPGAFAIHGITDEQRRGMVLPQEMMGHLKCADLVIAHNASFDRAMLRRTATWTNDLPWRCSVRQIKWRREQVSFVGLSSLLDRYKIHRNIGHRALDDALGLAKLMLLRDHTGNMFLDQLMATGDLKQDA